MLVLRLYIGEDVDRNGFTLKSRMYEGVNVKTNTPVIVLNIEYGRLVPCYSYNRIKGDWVKSFIDRDEIYDIHGLPSINFNEKMTLTEWIWDKRYPKNLQMILMR